MLKNTTYDLLMQGYNYYEISDKIPYTKPTHFPRIVKSLKDEGRITDEQIEAAKVDETEKRRMDIVLQGLERGLTYSETAEIDKSLNLTEQQFRDRKKKLVDSGEITDEEIEEQRKLANDRRSADKKADYEAPLDEEIKRLTKDKKSTIEIAQELGVTRSYVKRRKQIIRERAQSKKRGITKEDVRKCLEEAKFPEEQIQRILSKDLKKVLERGNTYKINKILRTLISYKISLDAIERCFNIVVDASLENLGDTLKSLLVEYKISKDALEDCLTVVANKNADDISSILKVLDDHGIEKEVLENCLSVLAKSNANEITKVFEVLDEYKIRRKAIEQSLYVLAKGKADNIRKILKLLKDNRISKSRVEGCLSILALGNADEMKRVLRTLRNNGVDNEAIDNGLYTVATGKSDEVQRIFDLFKKDKYDLDSRVILRNGIKMLEKKASKIEKIIVTLLNNGVRKEVIEEELSAIVNTTTPEEVEEMFNDNIEPKDKQRHYANVRRYMKLKELYGRVYTREEIESLCAKKHLEVKEFISEIQTYPRGKNFVDTYYEKLMTQGNLYIGGSTDIDMEYQEQHAEELIRLSRKVANRFLLRTNIRDRAELESRALEILLTKCGNLVYNLSFLPEVLMATMAKKTLNYLYAVENEYNMLSLTVDKGYKNGTRIIRQMDIPVEENWELDEEQRSLEDVVDYKKAKFSDDETLVMRCMIRLVENGEADDLTQKVAKIIIMDEEELCMIIARIRTKMLQNKLVTVRANGGYEFASEDDEREI